ncbi:DUF2637 domain-containing protein [Micromonospora rifamycinica]|uniref:DUF2637 domain-containing protein n=1 Tax=Micromonospora rifamycinica TaxID=291594 RepID=A0A1C5KFN8_9ACTN|nr:DUF2637 domain-containing protein [Micromonospora rifamycinica]SCG81570.1 Protein of unknown function [Micromonospora rifamycinica]
MTETRLRRMQWAVRATLALGVAASVTANILHAQANPIAQAIAAWPPLALLITVELVTRIPVHQRALGAIRVIAASTIAAIAAWISYHHMVGVVARYGETGTVPYLLPLSVDGLIIVASVSLVELSARRRESENPRPSPATATPTPIAAPTSTAQPPALGDDRPARPRTAPEREGTHTDPPRLDDLPVPEQHPALHNSEGTPLLTDRDSGPRADEVSAVEVDADDDVGLPADLVPLLPAARTARDELIREGHTVSRDALARRLRRNGHSLRNSGVSELLAAIRPKTSPAIGSRPLSAAGEPHLVASLAAEAGVPAPVHPDRRS